MPRTHLTRAAALTALVMLSGCTTTSQPVAQASSAKKATSYYTDAPETGSRIGRRYAVDDPNRPKAAAADPTYILESPTIGGPTAAPRGN